MTNLPSPSNTPSPSSTKSAPGGTPSPSASFSSTTTAINIDSTVGVSIVISMSPSYGQDLKVAMAEFLITWLGLASSTTYTITPVEADTALSFNFLVSTAEVPVYNPYARRRVLQSVSSVKEAATALNSLTAAKSSDGSLTLGLGATGLASSMGYSSPEDATNAVTPKDAAPAVPAPASPTPTPSAFPTPGTALASDASVLTSTLLLPLAPTAGASGVAAASVLFPPLYYSSYALAIANAAQVPFSAVVITGVKLRLTSDIVGSAVSAASGQPLGYQMAVAFDGKLLGPAFEKSITRALQEGCGSPAMTAISNELAARLGAAGALSAAFSALPQQVLAAAGYTPAYLAGQLFTDSTAPSGGRAYPACPTPSPTSSPLPSPPAGAGVGAAASTTTLPPNTIGGIVGGVLGGAVLLGLLAMCACSNLRGAKAPADPAANMVPTTDDVYEAAYGDGAPLEVGTVGVQIRNPASAEPLALKVRGRVLQPCCPSLSPAALPLTPSLPRHTAPRPRAERGH